MRNRSLPIASLPLRKLRSEAKKCQACVLHQTRLNVVFGVGNFLSPLLNIVSESPSDFEDAHGLAFSGSSGELLDHMLSIMDVPRTAIYATHAVLCRPPHNRTPHRLEQNSCCKYLSEQIKAAPGKAILALGKTAAQSLLKSEAPMHALRGDWYEWKGIPLRVTYHPNYVVKFPELRSNQLEDLLEVKRFLTPFKEHLENCETTILA